MFYTYEYYRFIILAPFKMSKFSSTMITLKCNILTSREIHRGNTADRICSQHKN